MSEIRCACGKYLIPAQGMAQLEDGVFHAEGMAPFCEHQALRAEVERLTRTVADYRAVFGDDAASVIERLTRERDEARADAAEFEKLSGEQLFNAARLVQERDRLAAALRRVVSFLESDDAEYRCTSEGWQTTLDAARAALREEK